MSTTVDNRVVQMQFDNAQFEKGVAQSTESLKNLKDNLDLTNSVKGTQTVIDSFNAMEIAIITSIANISNKITNLALDLTKSLTIDQVSSGFSKYEQELKAVQVILNSSTDSIETVTEELRRLSWYTDETSYSYSTMADAIAKFTTQGIDTTTAEQALEGIANMAGLAGASVTDASHAMEGFSKAMARGKMDQQSWAWIRTAKMNTQNIEKIFLEGAEAANQLQKISEGVYKDLKGNIVTLETFEATLKDGWMDLEAMNNGFTRMGSFSSMLHDFIDSYNDLTDSEIGATDALDMFNNKEKQSKEFLVAYGKTQGLLAENIDITTVSAEQLVEVEKDLAQWTENVSKKGFEAAQEYRTFSDAIDSTKDAASTQFKEIFSNLFGNVQEAGELWGTLGTAMNEFFVGGLYEYADIFKEFHDDFEGFKIVLDDVKKLVAAFNSVIEPVREALNNLFPKPTAQEIANFCYRLSKTIELMTLTKDASEGLTNALNILLAPIRIIATLLSFTLTVAQVLIIVIAGVINKLLELMKEPDKIGEKLESAFGPEKAELILAFLDALKNLGKVLKQIGTLVVTFFTRLMQTEGAQKALSALTITLTNLANVISKYLIKAFDKLASIDLDKTINALNDLFDGKISLVDVGVHMISGLVSGLSNGIKSLKDIAYEIANAILSPIISTLQIASPSKVGIAIGGFLIAGLVIGLSKSDTELGKALYKVTEPFITFFKTLDKGQFVLASFCSLFAISVSSVIFNTGKLIGGFANVLNGFASIEKSIASVGKGIGKYLTEVGKAKKWEAMASSLKYVTITVGILAGALIALSFIPKEGIDNALVAIAKLGLVIMTLYAAVTFISNMKKPAESVTVAETMADGVKKFLTKVGTASEIAAFGLIIGSLTTAFLKIAIALKILDKCENGTQNALLVMGGMVLVAIAFKALADTVIRTTSAGEMTKFGLGILALSAAIALLIIPIKQLAGMDAKMFAAGGSFIGACLVLFGTFAFVMSKISPLDTDIAKFGATMLLMATAIDLMLVPVLLLKGAKFEDVQVGLAFVGGCIALMIGMAAVMAASWDLGASFSAFGKIMIQMAVAVDLMLVPILVLSNPELNPMAGLTFIGGCLMIFRHFFDLMAKSAGQEGLMVSFGKCMLSMAAAIDLMIIPLIALKGWTLDQLGPGLVAIAAISAIFAAFFKMAEKSNSMAVGLKEFGICMMLMSASIVTVGATIALLSLIKNQGAVIVSAMVVVGILATMMQGLSHLAKSAGKDELIAAAASVAGLMVCLNALIPVILVLSKIPLTEMSVAVGAIVVTLGSIFTALFFLNKTVAKNAKGNPDPSVFTKIAESVALISGSMLLIAGAIAALAQFDCDRVAVAGAMIFANFGAIATALGLLNANIQAGGYKTTKGYQNIALIMIELSASMLLIAGAIAMCASFDPANVAVSGGILVGAYVAICASLVILNKVLGSGFDIGKMMLISGAIVLLSSSLVLIAQSLSTLANYDFASIAKSALALAGMLVVISAALAILSPIALGAIGASAAILIVAEAVKVMVGAIIAITSIDSSTIINFFNALGTSAKNAGQIALLGASLVALGIGLIAVSPGLLLISAALLLATPAILAFGVAMAGLAMVAGQSTDSVSSILDLLISKVPALCSAIGEGLANLLQKLVEAAPLIMSIIDIIVTGIVNSIAKNAPVIVNTILTVLDLILSKCMKWAPKIVSFVFTLLTLLLKELVAFTPTLIQAGIDLISALIVGIGNGALQLTQTAIDTLLMFLDGLSTAIVEKSEDIKAAGRKLIGALVTAITGSEAMGDFVESGLNVVDGFVKGIFNGIGKVGQAGTAMGEDVINALETKLDINSPSKVMYTEGEMVGKGFSNGLEAILPSVQKTGLGFATELKISMVKGANEIKDKMDEKGFEVGSTTVWSLVSGLATGKISISEMGYSLKKKFVDSIKDLPIISKFIGTDAMNALLGSVNKVTHGALEGNDDTPKVDTSDIEKGLGSTGSAAKSTAKSIEELAESYKFGEEAIKQFSISYGETILKLKNGSNSATLDVISNLKSGLKETKDALDTATEDYEKQSEILSKNTKKNIQNALLSDADLKQLSTKAVDNLAKHLYVLSDYYKQDLNNAKLDTETVLKNIQQAWSDAFSNIESEAKNFDWFSEITSSTDSYDIGKVTATVEDNISKWQEFTEIKKQIEQMNISDALKQKARDTGIEDMGFLKMLTESDPEDLEQLDQDMVEIQNIMETHAGQIEGAAAAHLVGLQNTVDGSATEIGMNFVNNLITPLDEAINAGVFSEKVMTLASNSLDSMRKVLDEQNVPMLNSGQDIGKNLCYGVYNGIVIYDSMPINAAKTMMDNIVANARLIAKVESPSKVFYEIGKFIDVGLANGIMQYTSVAVNASTKLSDSVIQRVNGSISRISDMVSDGVSDPTITPRLDLSEVQAGVSRLNGMIDSNKILASEIQNGSTASGRSINLKVTSPVILDGKVVARAVNEQLGVML